MSSISDLTQEAAISLIERHSSFQSVLHELGLCPGGGNYKALHQRFAELNVDTSPLYAKIHSTRVLQLTEEHNKGRLDASSVLIENSPYSRSVVRRILMQEKLLEYRCECCLSPAHWQGRELTLQIDHKNGSSNDHRLENLRFLCPNCHSQTESFAGRNTRKPIQLCVSCKRTVKGHSKRGLCLRCEAITRRRVDRPSKDELRYILAEHNNNFSAVGRHFGVSDNSIRKWLAVPDNNGE